MSTQKISCTVTKFFTCDDFSLLNALHTTKCSHTNKQTCAALRDDYLVDHASDFRHIFVVLDLVNLAQSKRLKREAFVSGALLRAAHQRKPDQRRDTKHVVGS
jgi:hypothetical protein